MAKIKHYLTAEMRTDDRRKRIEEVLGKRTRDLTVVLENINDPHNLSAAIRSCDAVGIMEVCLVYYGSQPFPKIARTSSASAMKWVNQRHFRSIGECYSALKSEGKLIYTTHMSKSAVSLYDLDLARPVALVFGNEHDGVSEEAFSLADGNFLIPQVGMIQSLNISVACAVSLFEAFRQRLKAGLYSNLQLDELEYARNLEEWVKK